MIFVLSRYQLADQLYRERLELAQSRHRDPEKGLRTAGPRRALRHVLHLASAARALIRPRAQAGSDDLTHISSRSARKMAPDKLEPWRACALSSPQSQAAAR